MELDLPDPLTLEEADIPLRLAIAPPEHLDRARDVVRRVMAGRNAPAALGVFAPPDLSLSASHPVFDLGASDLAAGKGLEAARPGGWRTLVTGPGGAVAAAEVGTEANAPAQVNVGPFVAATEKAILLAEALPDVVAGGFELRLLRIVALHVVALWLKSDDPARPDLLIPLPPAPTTLVAGRPYPAGALLDALREAARVKATTQAYHP